MELRWTQEQMDVIENNAYMNGVAVGQNMEYQRIIDLLENQEVEPLPAWDIYMRAVLDILEGN
jgi:hypothetical protein